MKFGISFNATLFNQAGALVNVYTDGTVLLNHGGTEMGQGLHTKVAQVVASEFGLPMSAIRVTTTDTSKVPNTSATAASSGSDLNGKAAQAAAQSIRARLVEWACRTDGVGRTRFTLRMATYTSAHDASRSANSFARHTRPASLSSTGYYRTPKIHWNREAFQGRPFFYFAYGAAISEVAVDTLTGETRVLRVDILHDVGRSLNPAIDLGQIEGGFLQGVGWLTRKSFGGTPRAR